MKFPKQLFVKIESERSGDTEYFVADDSAAALVEMNQKVKVATYQLVEIQDAEGVAQFKKAR